MKNSTTQFPYKKNEAGYSLIETIVYLALFITLSTMLIVCLVGMMRAYTGSRASDELLDSAHTSLERMTREIRNATNVASGGGTSTLVLDALDGSGSPKTVTFDLSGTVLDITDSTDGTARHLTGGKVDVTSLMFRKITTASGSAVRVEVTFQSERAGHKSISLTDTVVLRGDY